VQGDARWVLTPPGGAETSVPVQGPLRSNNLSAVLAAARDGLGLALLPWYVARESVGEGRLQPVMSDHALPAQDVHAVFPSPRLVPSKVTGFIGFLQQALRDEPWLEAAP
jgi:DNA-binding transcriptional LysR family regulator